MKIYQSEDTRLKIQLKGEESQYVQVKRSFPMSEDFKYLSFLDEEGKEVYFLNDIEELEEDSKGALLSHLKRLGFTYQIQEVLMIKDDIELRKFEVMTAQGKRTFQTKLDEFPSVSDKREVTIQDLYGDIYQVKDFSELSSKSLNELEPFID